MSGLVCAECGRKCKSAGGLSSHMAAHRRAREASQVEQAGSLGLVEAAASGDRVEALRSLRDRLARDLVACGSARDVAALSQRLMDVLEQIDGLEGQAPAVAPETGLSEFERKLREREQSA